MTVAGAINGLPANTIAESGPVAAGGSYSGTNTVKLPEQNGTYYLIYVANYGYYVGELYETNFSNNQLVSGPLTLTYQ